MQHVNLGRTGLKVSRLCLGTMNFGPQTSEPDAFAIMDKALEIGLQFFDTADVYGGKKGEGITEQIIGRWLAARGRKARDQVVIATKFQGTMGDGPNDRGASAYHIRAAAEASLQRLQTDHLDILQMHHVNRDTPWYEVFQAYETLVQQGKVLYFGSSNYAGWQIAAAEEAAKHRHFMGLVSEQSKFSLTCRYVELEVLPACRSYGLGVIPWSPLDGGFLAGVLDHKDTAGRRLSDGMKQRIAAQRPQLEQWESLCRTLGEKPADVALAWLLNNPAVTAPIIGPRTMEQLLGAQRALEIKLSAETLAKLDEIFPSLRAKGMDWNASSPYKYEAPEAYAW
jgi:aryl-alcohol dehydrogenase-like predicted oxidoreductase